MPSLHPGIPLQKATDLTKQLRSRDSGRSLLSLLDLAEQIFCGVGKDGSVVNVYFPKKEEWLLEWAVQRLKEEEGESGVEARLSPRFWSFVYEVLVRTEREVAARCLRKHGFLQLVGMTIEECQKRDWASHQRGGATTNGDGDVEMEDASSTEPWFSPEEFTRRQEQIRARDLRSLGRLLGDIAAVVEYLQESTSAGFSSNGGVIPVLRGTPELGGQILGGYLNSLLQALAISGKESQTVWAISQTKAMIGIWRGCVYGNADIKKTSSVFSKTCILPIYRLLSHSIANESITTSLEKLVIGYIFTPAFTAGTTADTWKLKARSGASGLTAAQVAAEALKNELCSLLSPLEGLAAASTTSGSVRNLMKIGIQKIMQGSTGKLTKTETVGSIFEALLTVLLGIKFNGDMATGQHTFSKADADIIHSLLTVISENGLSISDDSLRSIVTLTANLPRSRNQDVKFAVDVRWPIIELALTLDFDTFVISQSTSLLDRLVYAISASWDCPPHGLTTEQRTKRQSLLRIFKLLLEGFLKARDLDGFLVFWRNELETLSTTEGSGRVFSSIWTDEAAIAMLSNALERGYTPIKVDKVVAAYAESLSQAGNLPDLIILSALLRGVRREETEEKVKTTGTLSRLLTVLADGVHKESTSYVLWPAWQAIHQAIQLDGSLLHSHPSSEQIVEDALASLNRFVVTQTMESEALPEALACLEIIFASLACKHGDEGVKGSTVDLAIRKFFSEPSFDERWDGSILSLTSKNVPLAALFVIVKKWLKTIEALEQKRGSSLQVIENLVKYVLSHSSPSEQLETITARDIWDEMLRSEVIYELPGLRWRCVENLLIDCSRPAHYLLLLDSLSFFPLEAVTLKHRESVVKLVCESQMWDTVEQQPLDRNKIVCKERALMARFMNQPSSKYTIVNDPNDLIKWFNSLKTDTSDSSPALQSTVTAGRRILKWAMANKDQPRNVQYLTDLISAMHLEISQGIDISQTWQLALVCLQECWSGSTGQVKAGLHTLRNQMLAMGDKWLKDTSDPRKIATLIPIYGEALFLEFDGGEQQIAEAERTTARILEQWLPRWNRVFQSVSDSDSEHLSGVLTGLVGLRCLSPQTSESIPSTTAFVMYALQQTPTHRKSILASFTTMASKLASPVYLQAINTISESCFPGLPSDPDIHDCYILLSILITSAKKPTNPEEATDLTNTPSKIYSWLASELPLCDSPSLFQTITSCMHTLLRTHPWSISQFNIDETLCAITLCTSPTGASPTFPLDVEEDPPRDEIYTSLTQLLHTLLLGHRLRLKGRYHSLISTLQSLLRCLYHPAPTHKKTDTPIHPPWLYPRPTDPPLTPASAAAFTRLLTTLCDPAVSTVSKPTSTALLTSHTALAKKEVARYIPYLVMEHIYLQLQPHRVSMGSATREAVKLGVEACLEAMRAERGALKRCAAGLDAQGRALFKRMWEEFGKGGMER